MQSHQAIAALNARLDRSVGSLPGTERALLISALTTQVHELDILPESNGQGASTGHGVTLDWLAEKVTTPFLLTLDSDVEFLATGWLREMLNLLKRASLTALGEYEPGVCGYRSRLAPHLLLLRTSALHTHHWSFRGFVSIEDPDEAKRWRARPKSPNLDAEEAATYRSAAFYSTGAWLFESLVRTGERWMAIPESITHKFRHLRHASWAPYVAKGTSGARKLRAANKARQTYIQQRLRLY